MFPMHTLPTFTRRPKPDRENIPAGGSFQKLVEAWLCSVAMSELNRRHLAGEDLPTATELAEWLDSVATTELAGLFTDGHETETPAKHRLSLSKLCDGSDRRAHWVLTRWDPAKIEARRRGGRHGKADGTRKGPPPKWSCADLVPFWDMPARGRQQAVTQATGMSGPVYYRLSARMPQFMAERSQAEAARDAQAKDMAGLIPVPNNY